MKDYTKFLGNKNETWQQAVQRLESFNGAEMSEYFSSKDYAYKFSGNKAYTIHKSPPIPLQDIEKTNSETGVKIPQTLVDMLCIEGSFKVGEVLFEIFNDTESNIILSLSQLLNKTGHDEFSDIIKKDILKSIDNYYFFFGVCFPQSDESSFLYYNRAGTFGEMQFTPKNKDLMVRKIIPSMFTGKTDKYTLDSLISDQIDRIIINALTVKGYI